MWALLLMLTLTDFTPIFEWNWNSQKPLCINQGGSGSSKTYSLMQVCFLRAITNPGCIVTVTGQDLPNLKDGAMVEARKVLAASEYMSAWVSDFNKSEHAYTLKHESILQFKAYDDAQDARSGKRDFLFVNEANGIDLTVFEALYIRTSKQTYIDYNPDAEFWAHEIIRDAKAGKRDDVDVFYSNFRHNKFLDESIRNKLLSLKDTNPTAWEVYGLGRTGKVTGLIFPDAQYIKAWPEDATKIDYGLDFGYANDPACLVRSTVYDGVLIGDCMIYETGLNNKQLAERMTELKVPTGAKIFADSAEPKSIDELKMYGYHNIRPANKGRDSVLWGINWLKRGPYGIVANQHAWKEQKHYSWRIRDGKPTPEPIDAYNHFFDAWRYSQSGKITPEGGHFA